MNDKDYGRYPQEDTKGVRSRNIITSPFRWIKVVFFLPGRIEYLEKEIESLRAHKGSSRVSDAVKISDASDEARAILDKNPEIVSYVMAQLSQGVLVGEISRNLLDAGWKEDKIAIIIDNLPEASTASSVMEKAKGYAGRVSEEGGEIKDKAGAFTAWLKEDWIMKLGGLLLIIGFGWFIAYAIKLGWLGPMGQITLGILAGVAILILGEWRVRTFKNQGAFFLALGAGIILLTIFAGREVYGFFTPGVALGAMFITIIFTALSSVRHNSKSLAALSLILAFIAPLLTNSADPSFVSLFSYLFLTTIGILWIVKITKWNELTLMALVGISVYSIGLVDTLPRLGLIDGTTLFNTPFFFSIAFGMAFFAATMAGALKMFEKDRTDIITAGLNSIFIIGWILVAVPDVWQSLVAASWAVVFSIGAFVIHGITNNMRPFLVYGVIAGVFIGVATALELSGPALTIAAILEVLSVIMLTSFMTGSMQITRKTSFLIAIPLFLSIFSFGSRAWRDGIFHGDFVVIALMTITLLSLGLFFHFKGKRSQEVELTEGTAIPFIVLGGLYAAALLWLTTHALLSENVAVTISLAVYTISGIIMYIKGIKQNSKSLRTAGGVIIGCVVLRMLFIDVWNLDILGRIIAFFSIGVLLISTAFLGKKKKED